MKKILIISALDVWSMGEKMGSQALFQTLKGYADNNWKVFFITGNKNKNSIYDIHKNIRIIRFDCKWLKRILIIKNIGFFAKFIWWLYFQIKSFFIGCRIIRQERINILYGYEIYGIPAAKILSKLWKISVVSRFQGSILKSFWMKKKFWKIRAWQHVLAFKIPTDLVIMTQDGTQGDEVLQYFGVDFRKVKFWLNGVDWKHFQQDFQKEKIKKELKISSKYVLISISRLVNWKRVDRSIRALSRIVKEVPDLTLLIIGDGPERKNLEKLSRGLKVDSYVCFLGAVSHQMIPKYLAIADVFLSFYDWSNLGNPLIEAMMAGKCIVTLNNGNTGTIIKDKINGVLLEESNEERLINNISQNVTNLLKSPQLREKLGKNAKDFAKKNFWTWKERMNKEIREVEKLLKKK